ncbi:MAG TPA: YtxH domain-containing protein [Candidatus Saccharibacteria bacterium]|nr:YtxH domain-containing protein [Candidatus Saccharibacteria bacterium]HRK94485.1 YtxH domain-containing protein [Candidatus Saccharibacteria bacterium]
MGKRFAIGAIVGAAVGVVAGVLTAPKSGKETRAELKDKAGDLKLQAEMKKDEVVEKTEEVIANVKAKAKNTVKPKDAKSSKDKS